MANLTYRETSAASVITSTTVAGVPLTNYQVDANFKSINDDLALKATTVAMNSAIASALVPYSTTVNTSAADADVLSSAMAYAIALG